MLKLKSIQSRSSVFPFAKCLDRLKDASLLWGFWTEAGKGWHQFSWVGRGEGDVPCFSELSSFWFFSILQRQVKRGRNFPADWMLLWDPFLVSREWKHHYQVVFLMSPHGLGWKWAGSCVAVPVYKGTAKRFSVKKKSESPRRGGLCWMVLRLWVLLHCVGT